MRFLLGTNLDLLSVLPVDFITAELIFMIIGKMTEEHSFRGLMYLPETCKYATLSFPRHKPYFKERLSTACSSLILLKRR